MRWTLGSYTLKYNPKTLSKNWTPQNSPNMNANGTLSNGNLLFQGTQSFSVDIYDPPSKSLLSTMTGSYIGISEKRANEEMFLLKNNGTFDVKKKDNTLIGTYSIVSGNGVTIPSGYAHSINDFDSGLAFIYQASGNCQLLITDENGVANRKYTYGNDDSKYIEDIAWDYNSNFIALNPYGQIYTINTSTGLQSLLYQFDDYSNNLSSSIKRYTSIIMYEKSSNYYIGILRDTKEILFIDYNKLDIVSKSEIGLNNVLSISYSNYSGDCFSLLSSKIMKTTLGTSKIDVEIIKDIASNGKVEVYDEQGFRYILTISTIGFTRYPNSNEARYQAQIDGNIVYKNIGFGNNWVKNSRSI